MLDLGGVVFEIDWSEVVASLKLKETPHEAFVLSSLVHWDTYIKYECDVITTEEFRRELERRLDRSIPTELFQTAWTKLILGPIPGTAELIKKVGSSTQVYALSNSNRAHGDYLLANYARLMASFKKIFWSYELKSRKPDAQTFLKVCENLNLRPDEVLFVDDSMVNIEAARRLGILAHPIRNSSSQMRSLFRKYGLL